MATNLVPPGPPAMTSAQLTQFLHMLPWLVLGAPVFIAVFWFLTRRLAQRDQRR
jgi:H+/gluconate symporter-like permease